MKIEENAPYVKIQLNIVKLKVTLHLSNKKTSVIDELKFIISLEFVLAGSSLPNFIVRIIKTFTGYSIHVNARLVGKNSITEDRT